MPIPNKKHNIKHLYGQLNYTEKKKVVLAFSEVSKEPLHICRMALEKSQVSDAYADTAIKILQNAVANKN